MKELTSELERQAARPEVRAIVLKGAGRAFSAGHDLKEMLDRSLDEEREIFAVCNKLMATAESVPVPRAPAPAPTHPVPPACRARGRSRPRLRGCRRAARRARARSR